MYKSEDKLGSFLQVETISKVSLFRFLKMHFLKCGIRLYELLTFVAFFMAIFSMTFLCNNLFDRQTYYCQGTKSSGL